MKYGVIDVGSNSVRLMISDGVCTHSKTVKTTQLAKGFVNDLLQTQDIERTAQAVSFFYEFATAEKVDEIYVFATAAVRKAENKRLFLDRVKFLCGIDVDVISGETEAVLGCFGALNGQSGGVIDVGGASTEISVYDNDKKLYGKSVYVGAVSATDVCGQDRQKATQFIQKKMKVYGFVPKTNFYAIGGTATSLAALMQELDPYDPSKTDGYVINISELEKVVGKLFSLPIEGRTKLKGLQPSRAEVIANGALIVTEIMKMIWINEITVSEKDNLEGYLVYRGK